MKKKKTKIINKSDIMGLLHMHGPIGWILASLAMCLLGFNKVNKSNDRCKATVSSTSPRLEERCPPYSEQIRMSSVRMSLQREESSPWVIDLMTSGFSRGNAYSFFDSDIYLSSTK